MPPLILKSQIYTVLNDRTAADRDIDELRLAGKVRLFKLATGADEYVVMLAGDYSVLLDDLIHQARQRARPELSDPQGGPQDGGSSGETSRDAPGAAAVATAAAGAAESAALVTALQAFAEGIKQCADTAVLRSALARLLQPLVGAVGAPRPSAARGGAPAPGGAPQRGGAAQQGGARSGVPPSGCGGRGVVGVDAAISQLLNAGVLSRDPVVEGRFLLTVPGAAAAVRSLVNGRQELQALVSKRRFGDIREVDLMSKYKLRHSKLGVAFHLRDLLGRGALTRVQTTTGPVIRIVRR